jgi:hypothetical protein
MGAYDATGLVPFALRRVLAGSRPPVTPGPVSCMACRVIYTGRHVVCAPAEAPKVRKARAPRLSLVAGGGR